MFSNFLALNNLFDLDFLGYPFTWSNRRKEVDLVKLRSDQFVGSENLCGEWPQAKVSYLTSLGSNHRMVLLQVAGLRLKYPKRFVYNRGWRASLECKQAMEGAWVGNVEGRGGYVVVEKIQRTRMTILQWMKNATVNSGQEIRRLEMTKQFELDRVVPNYQVIS